MEVIIVLSAMLIFGCRLKGMLYTRKARQFAEQHVCRRADSKELPSAVLKQIEEVLSDVNILESWYVEKNLSDVWLVEDRQGVVVAALCLLFWAGWIRDPVHSCKVMKERGLLISGEGSILSWDEWRFLRNDYGHCSRNGIVSVNLEGSVLVATRESGAQITFYDFLGNTSCGRR